MTAEIGRAPAESSPAKAAIVATLGKMLRELDSLDEPLAAIHVQWAVEILTGDAVPPGRN